MTGEIPLSVVVVAKNEEQNIVPCLESVLSQNYKSSSLEILVIDNGSTDSTRARVKELERGCEHLRLLVQTSGGIATCRNVGLREARYDQVVFLDADCVAKNGWLRSLASAFEEERRTNDGVVAVGGPNIAPEKGNFFRTSLSVAHSTYWGNYGSVQSKVLRERIEVEHVPTLNVLYDRKFLLELGGFDEAFGSISEDNDMSYRIRGAGGVLIYEPNAIVEHKWRQGLIAWVSTMFVYGQGRVWFLKKFRSSFRTIFIAPTILLTVSVLAFVWPQAVFTVVLSVYFLLTLLISAYSAFERRRPQTFLYVFIILILTHYAYAIGQVHGFFFSGKKFS